MQDDVRASPRLMAVAAIAMIAAAIMAFTWLSGNDVAGAQGTSGSAPSGQFQPIQQEEGQQAAPDADGDGDGPRAGGGRDCPKEGPGGGEGQGSGSSGGSSEQSAPSTSATPGTEL